MIRTRTWFIVGVVLGSALIAGTILAQNYQPGYQPSAPSGPASSPQPKGTLQPPSEGGAADVYTPVTAEALGISSEAQRLIAKMVKVPDVFYEEVRVFPPDAIRAGITPDKYYAFRTRPDGSDLICFIQLDNADLPALRAAGPPRGAQILIMGLVGRRMFVGDSGATSFAVDHIFLGHEEPKVVKPGEKKPVILTIERFGPAGNIVKQQYTIEKAGQRYLIHDPADPQNAAKDIYVTLQF